MSTERKLIVCQHCGDIWMNENGDGRYKVACTCGFAERKVDWKLTERDAIKTWNRVAYDWY